MLPYRGNAFVFAAVIVILILLIIGLALFLKYRKTKKARLSDPENQISNELTEFKTTMHINHQKLREKQQARASGSGSEEVLTQLPRARASTFDSHPSRLAMPPRANTNTVTFARKSRPDGAFNPRLRQEQVETNPFENHVWPVSPRRRRAEFRTPPELRRDEGALDEEQDVGAVQMPPLPRGATSFDSLRDGPRASRFQEHLDEGESSRAGGEKSVFGPHGGESSKEEWEEVVLDDSPTPASASRTSFATPRLPAHWGRVVDSRLG